MKKSIIITLILAFASIANTTAQSKIGYVEYDYLLSLMPQMENVAKNLEGYSQQAETMRKEAEDQIRAIQEELQNPRLLPAVRDRYTKIYEQSVQDYQQFVQQAQYQIDSVRQVEIRKVADTLDLAISEVAEEEGLDYVLTKSNNSGYNIVYTKNESDDISPAVMKKLGIVDPKNDPTKQPNNLNSGGATPFRNPFEGGGLR